MMETKVYYPQNANKFYRNLQRRGIEFAGRMVSYNSESFMRDRPDKSLVYHLANAAVVVSHPTDDRGCVSITSTEGKTGVAKSLLEEIGRVKLVERT